MRRRAVYPLFLLLALAAAGIWGRQFARESPERLPAWLQQRPSIYLDLALKHVRTSAITAGDVDWNAVAERAHQAARGASRTADTYAAIRAALAQVGEDVGQLEPPAAEAESGGVYGLQALFPDRVVAIVYPGSPAAAAGIRPGDIIERVNGRDPVASADPRTRGQFVEIPRPTVTLTLRRATEPPFEAPLSLGGFQPFPAQAGRIGADLGFVSMPAVSGDDGFVRQVREAIAAADGPSICGWVVDLRRTNGGAFWPVLQAIRPILGEGPLGGWLDREGRLTSWTYPDDAVRAPLATLQHPEPAIAVLTSRITANAGEMASVAFRGHPRARVFGEPTWGSPANRTRIRLPDGATLVLASALATDRSGRSHAGRIRPDEAVTIDWSEIGTPDDKVMVAAATWLRSTEGCRNRPRR